MVDDNDVFEPEWNGNRYLPFADLMAVDRVDQWTYRSVAKPFAPGAGTGAYGGHVYAQAVYAASKTINQDEPRVVCNVTGFFTRPGNTSKPFVYRIRPVQDGRMYTVRSVEVTQSSPSKGANVICFACTATFKREEDDNFPVQETLDVNTKYAAALGDKRPADWPECPSVDSPWFWDYLNEHGHENNPKFPGLHSTKVNMDPYNKLQVPMGRRQLQYYSVVGPDSMPSIQEDPNLHAAAHLYASDRNSLFAVTNLLDIGNDYLHMASLSHTVVFHTNPAAITMLHADASPNSTRANTNEDPRKWFCEEARVARNGVGRCLRESRIWDEHGLHIATSVQDGLVRLGEGVQYGGKMRSDFEKQKGGHHGSLQSAKPRL